MRTWNEAYEAYDEFLDSTGEVEIGTLTYSASRVLKEVDPTAYRVGLADFLDSEGVDSDELEE